jgi:hypothetical protein
MATLGDLVRDRITGASGIVVCVSHYLTGCTHVQIQGKAGKDGKPPEWISIEETRCEVLKKGVEKVTQPARSGPVPMPAKW